MLTLASRLRSGLYAPRTLSFLTSASSVDYNGSLTMPASIQEGDLIIVTQKQQQTADLGSVVPSAYAGTGFTAMVGNQLQSTERTSHGLSRKIAVASDAGATIGGFFPKSFASWSNSAIILVYRPSRKLTSDSQISGLGAAFSGKTAGPTDLYSYNATAETWTTLYLFSGGSKVQSLSELAVTGFPTLDYSAVVTTGIDIGMKAGVINTPTAGASVTMQNNNTGPSRYPTHVASILRIKP